MYFTLDVTGSGDHINSDKVRLNCHFAIKYSCKVNSNNLGFTFVFFAIQTLSCIFVPVLHTFLPACLLTLPTYLSIPLPTYLPVSLPTPTFLLPACTYQPTCTYQPYLPIFLPPFLIAHLSANLLSYPIYLSASACLPSYLYHLLTSSPKKCPLRCVPRTLKTRVKKKMSKMFPFILYLLSREVTK